MLVVKAAAGRHQADLGSPVEKLTSCIVHPLLSNI